MKLIPFCLVTIAVVSAMLVFSYSQTKVIHLYNQFFVGEHIISEDELKPHEHNHRQFQGNFTKKVINEKQSHPRAKHGLHQQNFVKVPTFTQRKDIILVEETKADSPAKDEKHDEKQDEKSAVVVVEDSGQEVKCRGVKVKGTESEEGICKQEKKLALWWRSGQTHSVQAIEKQCRGTDGCMFYQLRYDGWEAGLYKAGCEFEEKSGYALYEMRDCQEKKEPVPKKYEIVPTKAKKAKPSVKTEKAKASTKDKVNVGKDNDKGNVKANGAKAAVLPSCSKTGINLVGPLLVNEDVPDIKDIEKIENLEGGHKVEKGGWYKPKNCSPRVKVAVIIPYRKRFDQLKVFLRHIHPMLQRQELFYRIFVVEQLGDDPFNRAALFNAGYTEALKYGEFNCFVFSDVDLIPEDDRIYYGCPTSPRHMSAAVDKFDYKILYETLLGGVTALTKEHFETINGFSNLFFGWGGEDDDLYKRTLAKGLKLTRESMDKGRYKMLKFGHFQSSTPDPNRMNLLRSSEDRMAKDGLNSLKYTLSEIQELPLMTLVRVTISKSMYAK